MNRIHRKRPNRIRTSHGSYKYENTKSPGKDSLIFLNSCRAAIEKKTMKCFPVYFPKYFKSFYELDFNK